MLNGFGYLEAVKKVMEGEMETANKK